MDAFVFTFALRDFLRAKRLIAWLVIVAALFGIAAIVSVLGRTTGEALYLRMSGIFLFRVESLAAAIFSTAVISAEMEQKTIVYLVTRPIARWKLVALRTLAATCVTAIVGVLAAAALAIASYGPAGLGTKYFMNDLLACLVGAAFYTSFFTLLSLWINRSMIVSLLFAFGWETIVPSMPGDMRYLTIGAYLDTISKRPALPTGDGLGDAISSLSVNTMALGTAWTTSIIAIVVCFVVGALWFSTHEYLPREDVE